ncbi:MAG: tetratricopeptide repeat protein [Burkholderiales bacterium]|nr:tetratricopeptide repeat protein [Burkholderiales bacterium]
MLSRGRGGAAEGARALAEALRLEASGRIGEARERLRSVLAAEDDASVPLLSLLGRLEAQAGEPRAARELLARAARLDPRSADVQADLGNVHAMMGESSAATRCYRAALALDPQHVAAHCNIGLLLARDGERNAALDHFRAAVAANPEFTPAIRNLVAWLPDDAVPTADIAMVERIVARFPDLAEAHAALGALHLRGAFDAQPALTALDRAIALGLDEADVHTRRGVALHELGRFDAALEAFGRALAHDPDHVIARFHRAITLLALGRFAAGWPDYELRLRSEDRPQRAMPGSPWRGEPLDGRTVLVHAEQGVGDEILFASCLPDLIRASGTCIVECDARLAALYRRSFPDATIVGGSQHEPIALPPEARVDFHVPIGSLPGHLRCQPAEFPAHAGYLRADPQRAAAWRACLTQSGRGPVAGIAWRGGTLRSRGPGRSIELGRLAPILAVRAVTWVCLQRGAAPVELETIELTNGVHAQAFPDALEDLDETAALLAALDLVVTIDSTVAQLAGALGRPAWVLLPVGAEWRYGVDGERMPWYPSARLFRQSLPNDWAPVVGNVARELCTWAGEAHRSSVGCVARMGRDDSDAPRTG